MLKKFPQTIFKNTNIKNNLFNKLKVIDVFKFNNSFIKQNKFFSSHYVNHRNTVDNNEETPFDFTNENYKKIDEILVQ